MNRYDAQAPDLRALRADRRATVRTVLLTLLVVVPLAWWVLR